MFVCKTGVTPSTSSERLFEAHSVKTHLHSQTQQVAPPGGPSYKRSTTETDRNRLQQYHGRVIRHPKPSVSTRTHVAITFHMKKRAIRRGSNQGPTDKESETLPTELSGIAGALSSQSGPSLESPVTKGPFKINVHGHFFSGEEGWSWRPRKF